MLLEAIEFCMAMALVTITVAITTVILLLAMLVICATVKTIKDKMKGR